MHTALMILVAFQTAAAQPAPFPGGLVDRDKKIAILETADGLAAIDTDSGHVLWTSRLAFRPLHADSKELLAAGMAPGRGDAIRVLSLDLAAGMLLLASEPIVLPDWIVPDDPDPAAFRISARYDGRRVLVKWRATRRRRGGAPPGLPELSAADAVANGAVLIDLATGAVRQEDPDREESAERELPTSAPYLRHGSWHDKGWAVDGDQRTLIASTDGQLSLGLGGARTIRLGGLPRPVATVAADGRHVLIHADSATPGGAWLIFSAVSGEQVGVTTYDPGALDPVLIGDRFYYLIARGQNSGITAKFDLTAHRLGAAGELWSVPISMRTMPRALPR